jgi:murein L,D-transpeptidase YafK
VAQRLNIKEAIILPSMSLQKFTYVLLCGAVMLLASFTTDKGKKKKPAAKPSKAIIAKKKPAPTPVTEAVADNPYYIIIDKSDYELKVYDAEGWYATYPIVFGSKDLSDKQKEGDRRTPDGKFKVVLKKIHPKWSYELLLDYPNDESVRRFNQRKASGSIPKNARIGDGIAIHATRKDEEWTVDNFYNWTDGCVSVKYSEMKDLYSYIPVGTPVTIQQ